MHGKLISSKQMQNKAIVKCSCMHLHLLVEGYFSVKNFCPQNKVLALLRHYVQNEMLKSLNFIPICQLFTYSTRVKYNAKLQIKQTHILTALLRNFLQGFNIRQFPRCCFCHSIGAILDLLCCHASRDLVGTLVFLTLWSKLEYLPVKIKQF